MKDKHALYIRTILITVLIVLISLIIVLVCEERFFWEQARLLSRAREECATYELGLKRMIAERQRARSEEAVANLVEGAKKKNDAAF